MTKKEWEAKIPCNGCYKGRGDERCVGPCEEYDKWLAERPKVAVPDCKEDER